jgi:serine protease AprX
MTSSAAAGNGFVSRGLYRGMAPDAGVVLVRARDAAGGITSDSITRALGWLVEHHHVFDIRIASVSLGGDPTTMLEHSGVDAAVATLVDRGVTVVVAAGNDGQRNIVPPATASAAVTVGGLDDRNVFDRAQRELWHSSYGETWMGNEKPELVAPSIWVAAPVLPDTDVAREATHLFERRSTGDQSCEARIAELKLVTPFYQHVEGTSFAAPIVAGIVACMLEANPALTPRRIRDLLLLACKRVDGAPDERQGAGAIDAGAAVTLAATDEDDVAYAAISPAASGRRTRFILHDPDATSVRIVGSWDNWATPGFTAAKLAPSLWQMTLPPLSSGEYAYKFVLDDSRWITDPTNRRRRDDGFGATNSVFVMR